MIREKILIILPFLPFPLNSGGNQGVFHMINFMKDYFDIYVWFHVNSAKKIKNDLDAFNMALDGKVHLNYTENKVGRNFITARALKRKFEKFFIKNDPQFQHDSVIWGEGGICTYCDWQAIEDINSIIKNNGIKLVQVEFPFIMEMVYALPQNVKKVFIHHELAFAKHETLMKQLDKVSLYDEYQFRQQKEKEILCLNQYDEVVVFSDIDKKKLEDAGTKTNIKVSPLFIPKGSELYPQFKATSNRLSYVASGTHYPNVEGLKWFLENVHPLLQKSCPNYKLDVIGTNWSDDIKKSCPSNIEFKGFVEDLKTIVPGSVMIVPILSGSGMRMKILEAVNNSVPFVSTSIGAEGMPFVSAKDCFITDDPTTFANQILELFNNKQKQMDLVESSRIVYENNYSPKALGTLRCNIIKSCLESV